MAEVTVGVVVYNGAQTLRAALDSLLAQTFHDVAIIISDNASTDATADICTSYARRDPRIDYVRLPHNIGAAMNLRRVLQWATTPYFMWAAADDLWSPDFIKAHHDFLASNPDYVASQSRVIFRSQGFPTRMSRGTYALRKGTQENTLQYYSWPGDNSRFYALFRTEALRSVYPDRAFFGFDWAVSAGTLRFGKHNEVPDILMVRDETYAPDYAASVASYHNRFLLRLLPLHYMTYHIIKYRLVRLNLRLAIILVKLNAQIASRFALFRMHKSVQTRLKQKGQSLPPYALSLKGLAWLTGPGLRERVLSVRDSRVLNNSQRAARRGAQIDSRDYGWAPLPRARDVPAVVTIITIARNQLADIMALTQKLGSAIAANPFELVVVDRGSTDATGICLRDRSDMTYLACESTATFASAVNRAVEISRGANLVFVDPSAILHVGELDGLIAALTRENSHQSLLVRSDAASALGGSESRLRPYGMTRATYEKVGGFQDGPTTLDAATLAFAATLKSAGGRTEIVCS